MLFIPQWILGEHPQGTVMIFLYFSQEIAILKLPCHVCLSTAKHLRPSHRMAVFLGAALMCSRCHAGLTKLDDANDAGGRNSEQCTLILTEGDSAKSLVIAGMSVAGRDKFGVFPLRCRPTLWRQNSMQTQQLDVVKSHALCGMKIQPKD